MFVKLAALVLLFAALETYATSCNRVVDCISVSDSLQYVTCSGGQCACLVQQGFIGNATAANKCRCHLNSQLHPPTDDNRILEDDGKLFCLDVDKAAQALFAQSNCQNNKATVQAIYKALEWINDTVNPLPWIYAAIGQPSPKNIYDLFDPAGKIRVKPFGIFPNPENAILYYLVFAITNTQVPHVSIPYLYCENNLTYVRADIGFGFAGQVFLNITEVGTYTMTPANKVISGDAYAIDIGVITAASVLDPDAFITGICADLTQNAGFYPSQAHGYCPQQFDSAGFYANYTDCVNFMRSRPFGSYWTASPSNSVVCAAVHATMAFWNPTDHCPHAGKTGSGACEDVPYGLFFQQAFKKRSASVGLTSQHFSELVARLPPTSFLPTSRSEN